jgi:hypothetical protein
VAQRWQLADTAEEGRDSKLGELAGWGEVDGMGEHQLPPVWSIQFNN